MEHSFERSAGSVRDVGRPELADLARLGRRLVRVFVDAARAGTEPTPADVLVDHLGSLGATSPVVGTGWPSFEHVNVQVGLEAWLELPGRSHRAIGLSQYQHRDFSLGDLAQPSEHGPRLGNTSMVQLATGPDGKVHDCARCAVYLVDDETGRCALLLREADPHGPGGPMVRLEVLSDERARSDGILSEIAGLVLERNVFRGQVLSFGSELFGPRDAPALQFLRRSALEREALVLPEGLLGRIERQAVGIAAARAALRAAHQHVKRGILLYGPPGTGKTHTIRYLLGRLEGVTVVLLSGNALASIRQACSIARTLQPSAVIVEDVDLIAEQRGMHPGQHPLLFQLLNEMDGLGEDVDVVFLLTTNRADLLEPALAARPGRVDLAVEIPLPDAGARRALLELYRGRLRLELSEEEAVLARTDGVTASFLKELLRRAALVSLDGRPELPVDEAITVRDAHLHAALDELLDPTNGLTRTLLGGARG